MSVSYIGNSMNLSNLSQVLLRNEELLVAQAPLLINMPNDDLNKRLLTLNPECEISYFDNNYQQHQEHKTKSAHRFIFDAQYQTNIVHDLIILNFPKSKKELLFTLAMLAQCTTPSTKVLIVGENKSGIKSINKLITNQCAYCEKVDSARHCILFEVSLVNQKDNFDLEEWFHYYQVDINDVSFKVAALPGVFSQAKLDIGSKILLEHLPTDIGGNVLDFGCGAGVIGCYIAITNQDAKLFLADVSALALASATKTFAINQLNGETIATNSLSNINQKFHAVISNPPFHQGIKTNYVATEQFLAGIKHNMEKQASLTIVANSFLKYQSIIEESIGRTERLCTKQGFTIYHTILKS